MVKITFLRHAQYDLDSGNIFTTDYSLNEPLQNLKKYSFDAIFHSPTLRAVQTSQEMQKEFNAPLIEVESIRNGYFFTGVAVDLEERIQTYGSKKPLVVSHLPILQGFSEHYTKKCNGRNPKQSFGNLKGFSVDTQEQIITLVPSDKEVINHSSYKHLFALYEELAFNGSYQKLNDILEVAGDVPTAKTFIQSLEKAGCSYSYSSRTELENLLELNNTGLLETHLSQKDDGELPF